MLRLQEANSLASLTIERMEKRQHRSARAAKAGRGRDRQFMVALARGLEVLKSIGENPGTLGNAEIARLTSLAKATVSRLTYTLSALGYIEYVEQLGRYRVAAGYLICPAANHGLCRHDRGGAANRTAGADQHRGTSVDSQKTNACPPRKSKRTAQDKGINEHAGQSDVGDILKRQS
jgi:hypothetical protein